MKNRGFAVFRGGSKDPLLTTVGVPYGWLYLEGCDPTKVVHLVQGKLLLADGVDKGVLTSDQAGELQAAMVDTGLLADEAALYKAVASFKVSDDYKPAYTFRVYGIGEGELSTMPHGHILNDEKDVMVSQIRTLEQGFSVCIGMARDTDVHVLDAVTCFQAMVAADLPRNDDEFKARYNALPEATRAKVESAGRVSRAILIDVPGLGRMVAFDLPRGFMKEMLGIGKPEENDKDKGAEDAGSGKEDEGRRRR